MYIPPLFKEDRIDVLHDGDPPHRAGYAGNAGRGRADRQPRADAAGPGPGALRHADRPSGAANPQARGAVPGVQALAIFQGPDAYITPSWYATKRENGKVVPTWNYVAIHAHGPVEFFDDAERLRDVVTRLTEREEQARAEPWAVSDAPAEFIDGMLKGIVGFALPIARLEGKWKMSQNRPAQDRAGVVAGLEQQGREDVAALVPR